MINNRTEDHLKGSTFNDLVEIGARMATRSISLSRRDRTDIYPVRRLRRRGIKVPVGGLFVAEG